MYNTNFKLAFYMNSSLRECKTCPDSHILLNNECKNKQIDNCISYDNKSNICVECEEGFYFNKDNYSCSSCPNNCKHCGSENGELKCYSCDENYILSDDSNCSLKVSECNRSFNGYCILCNNGMINDTKCISCNGNGCKQCLSDSTCLLCNDGYNQMNLTSCQYKFNASLTSNNNVV